MDTPRTLPIFFLWVGFSYSYSDPCLLLIQILFLFSSIPCWSRNSAEDALYFLIFWCNLYLAKVLEKHFWSWKSPGKVLEFCHKELVWTLDLCSTVYIKRFKGPLVWGRVLSMWCFLVFFKKILWHNYNYW